ncbi:MAG: ABC transporter permease [Lacunisphaera sp.]
MNSLRFACRQLARTPGLTIVIVLSLAVGIGANTVIFSWLKSAFLNPLPGVHAPVFLLETKDDTGTYSSISWLEYRELCGLLPSFSAVAAQRQRSLNLGDSENGERVFAELVSGNFFPVLGVTPQLGRFFRTDEATKAGSAPVVVIGHDFWAHHFKGASDVLGKELKLNGTTFTVIGVAPAGFRGGYNNLAFDVFLPLTMAGAVIPATSELTQRGNRPYTMLAQLKSDTTLAQARGELAAAARHFSAAYPELDLGRAFELLPLWRSPRGGASLVISLVTLQVFTVLILVVVGANTATLLLARASVRQREIGIRLAIGAGPARIIFQLLLESVCLALLGAAAGLILALWGVDALASMPMPGNLPLHFAPELDWASIAFASALASTCGILFGLAPALQLARTDIIKSLRNGSGSIAGRSLLRDLLIGLEVGVALVVIVLAALFLRSFHNALQVHPGFDSDRVMLVSLDLGGRGYTGATGGALLDELLQRLSALPGVESAAAANYVPLDLRGASTGVISIPGEGFNPNRKIIYYDVTPHYFSTLGIPLISGTDLSPRARTDLPLDAVIGDEMARRYWPDENPLGHHFEIDGATYLVAGVARTPTLEKINESPQPVAWVSMRTQFVSVPHLYVRAKQGDPRALLPAIRETVHQLDPEIAVLDPRTLAQHVENNLFGQRVPAQMLAILGPLALLLAVTGLYAVLAYAVAQRTREIGVRLALGATPASVVRLMIWSNFRIVLVSVAIGWAVSFGAGWYLHGYLVNVPLGDPLIYAGTPALLFALAAFACWLPARRATRIDPMVALRAE